jgi:hypothetical protein
MSNKSDQTKPEPLEIDEELTKDARLSALPPLVDSVKRIRHFATGRCDMPLETRLQCIAKECEASLSKLDADWREAQEGAK